MELTPKTGGDSHALVDPLKLIPLLTIGLGSETPEDVMSLSEYKLDQSRLAVVKRTPKCRNALVDRIEKPVMEGFEESMLWDIYGPDVAQVGVETSVVIVGITLIGQSSTKAMAKEIARLKQSTTRVQAELTEHEKNTSEDKQRSLDELKISPESKYE